MIEGTYTVHQRYYGTNGFIVLLQAFYSVVKCSQTLCVVLQQSEVAHLPCFNNIIYNTFIFTLILIFNKVIGNGCNCRFSKIKQFLKDSTLCSFLHIHNSTNHLRQTHYRKTGLKQSIAPIFKKGKTNLPDNYLYILLHGYFCIDLSMCPVNMYFPEGRRPNRKYMFTGHIWGSIQK